MGFLGAVGRAQPAIRQAISDVQEIPFRQQRLQEGQNQLAIQGQNLEMNKVNLNKMKADELERKKQEEFLGRGWDISLEPWPDEMKETFKKQGIIDPQTGRGTQRDRIQAIKMISTNKELAHGLAMFKAEGAKSKVLSIKEQLEVEESKPNANPEKIAGLTKQLKTAMDNYNITLGKTESFENSAVVAGQIEAWQKAGVWQTMPPELQQVALMAAKSGDKKIMETFATKLMELYVKKNAPDTNLSKTDVTVNALREKLGRNPTGIEIEAEIKKQEQESESKKNQTKEQLTARALRGDKEAEAILKRMKQDEIDVARTKAAEGVDLKKIAAAQQMSNQFDRNPITQHYRVGLSYSSMLEAAEKEAKTTKNFIAVDQTYGNVIQKLLDPNAIRIEEYRRTKEDQAAINKIRGAIAKQFEGGAGLTPQDRAAISRMVRQGMEQVKTAYVREAKTMRGKAEKAGLDPDLVVPVDWETSSASKGNPPPFMPSQPGWASENGKKTNWYFNGKQWEWRE